MSDVVVVRTLTVTVDRSGNVPVVRCSGRLVAGATDRFYSAVKQLVPEYKRVVLDFTEVTHMDSMGLGTLVRLYVHAKSSGSVLDLVNVGKSVRQLLGISHMMSVFQLIGENNIRMG
jgi:anti-anti-sigma factor